jgi:hypothetical protein
MQRPSVLGVVTFLLDQHLGASIHPQFPVAPLQLTT